MELEEGSSVLCSLFLPSEAGGGEESICSTDRVPSPGIKWANTWNWGSCPSELRGLFCCVSLPLYHTTEAEAE